MRRWRVPLALTLGLVLAQLFRTSPIVDVVADVPPQGVHLTYPLFHAVFAPFSLLADYLNGGSVTDLKAFGTWTLVIYVLARLATDGRSGGQAVRRSVREARAAAWFLVAVGLFLWWGARWSRPIARLVADEDRLIIFDIHSHTSASHDGRKGFGAAANAAWHARAGFDAAFVTDHNVFGAAREWQHDRAGRPPRLLNGEELSLSGLHMIVLGNDSLIPNKPWDASFDSSLSLLSAINHQPSAAFIIASLPEYDRNHWGPDLGRLIGASHGGLEIWTTSPKAMEFPEAHRREVIARAASLGTALFGASDMHGLGYAANVWNVALLPGWRSLSDSALTRALIEVFNAQHGTGVKVVARRRSLGDTGLARAFALPLGVLTVVRSVSPAHLLSLLIWCWVVPLIRVRRRPPPTP